MQQQPSMLVSPPLVWGLLLFLAAHAEAGMYTVTSAADSGPGSLRAALDAANADEGASLIQFGIGTGIQVISLASPLPTIANQMTIDGSSQPGYTTSPLIIITGGGTLMEGLRLHARNCNVSGLAIQDFAGDGLVLDGGGDNVVMGNFIGSDFLGTSPRGNGAAGIRIVDSSGNRIGGLISGQGNVISANGIGILIEGSGSSANRVQGNFIGTAVGGASALGNTLEGVVLTGGAAYNEVGGADFGAGNSIAYNGRAGVLVGGGDSTVGNSILKNSIFANGGLGINLQPAGEPDGQTTLNDPLGPDADKGPNNLQNFPRLTSVNLVAGTTLIRGTLDSTPSRPGFRIDLYRSATVDVSGYGQGQVWLDSVVRTTDLGGNATFTFTVPGAFPNQYFTATATDPATGDTSEFSEALWASAGKLAFSAPTYAAWEEAGVVAEVRRLGGSYGAVTLDYATSTHYGDTRWATEGLVCGGLADYRRVAGTLTFADGDTKEQVISVPLCNDALVEGDERLTLTLSNPTGGAWLDEVTKEATPFILDDEIALSISDASVSDDECAPYDPTAVFTVSLPAPIPRDVSVRYATEDGTATEPGDYQATSGTLTIPAGSTSATVKVPVRCDTLNEGTETFTVALSDPVNARVAKGTGVCHISDLRIAWMPCCAAARALWFKSSPNSFYRLEFSTSLDANAHWSPVPGAEQIPGNGQIMEVYDQTSGQEPVRFYRLVEM